MVFFEADVAFVLIGLVAGVLAGMLPGVGMAVLMITVYPILYLYEPIQAIQFYLSAILVSQFMGSVVATYFAVPGESSSIPAVVEGHKLAREGKATQAIFIAAGGSFIGGIIAFIGLYLLGMYLMDVFRIFTTVFNVIIISLVFVLIFATPATNMWERILFPVIGGGLSLIGMTPWDSNTSWAFGIEALEPGVPDMAILLGLYTLPLLWHLNNTPIHERLAVQDFNIRQIVVRFRHFILSIFYGIYGFIVGFMPGIGLGIVSNTAYALQKRIDAKMKLGTPGENQLLAAETANNSGAFAIMLPLLIFGIPTTTSQAVLYNLLIDQNYDFGPLSFDAAVITGILTVVLFTTFVGFLLAGPLARLLALFFSKSQKHIYIGISILMIVITLYVGYTTIDFWLYLWTIVLSCIFGMVFFKYDILKIIYFFIITPFFVENWGRLGFILDIY